jgi:hypothetical protein
MVHSSVSTYLASYVRVGSLAVIVILDDDPPLCWLIRVLCAIRLRSTLHSAPLRLLRDVNANSRSQPLTVVEYSYMTNQKRGVGSRISDPDR